jgi:hypothetical protein
MLESAVKASNIDYRACPAEKLPFEDKSVDIITTAQAFHWFKHEEFFREASIKGSQKASDLVEKLGLDTLGNYWGE